MHIFIPTCIYYNKDTKGGGGFTKTPTPISNNVSTVIERENASSNNFNKVVRYNKVYDVLQTTLK